VDRWLAKLERRFGRYAPQGLIFWIVGLNGLGYLLCYARPELRWDLNLDPVAIAHGEVWRVVTFLFLPWQSGGGLGILLTAIALWFLYSVGSALEAQWGAFRFALYYLLGALGTLAASFIVGSLTSEYVNLSLLLAFATEFPDYEILFMFILPLKMRWVGLISAAGVIWALAVGTLQTRAGVVVAMANYLLFFGPELASRLRRVRPRAPSRTSEYGPQPKRARVCAKCGRSNGDEPNLEFRLCDCAERCHGKLTEYCIDHARAH
jgi:membrane associated rhomboid family serine protease